MECKEFDRVQLQALLGEASSGELREAAEHARDCDECRRDAVRDRWLGAAFEVDGRSGSSGFAPAHRKLMRRVDERRAYCSRVEGPFGPVLLARTPRGLCRVSFRRSEESFLSELERRELLPEFAPRKLAREAGQLERYFAGRLERFDLPLDLGLTTPFQRQVLQAAARVPFGKLASYSDIARRIGRPGARRAVGGALGRNPVAIVIPCHRVVAADGSIGGYTGGLKIKRALLDIEGVSV
jgi:methylated-DNA-[protein]-cysteine S-methyltransferase